MIYKVIGLMSGSSLDGLDIAYVHFNENAGKWTFEIIHSECLKYSEDWQSKLLNSTGLSAIEYNLLHSAYGHYLGESVNQFITKYGLQHQVDIISSHGHTTFHIPAQRMTAQLGDGAALAGETRLPVVTDLRAIDIAFGGQGAPIVPIGEKFLFPGISYFLNLGGIANISSTLNGLQAFDICAANRVLNLLANELKMEFDEGGKVAASGSVNDELFNELNNLQYYDQPPPKSLPNSFGTDEIYPMITRSDLSPAIALRTYVEHIALQVKKSLMKFQLSDSSLVAAGNHELLITGGGAMNDFMVARIVEHLQPTGIEVLVPSLEIINFKEALIMAFIGILRWREEYNVLATVTGASRNTIGGALWLGTEA